MISNPFGKKEPERKKPWGNENPYRIFGVNEEAPYEEVERAFKELVAENEGNEKYIMQLEMMKEDIFDQRLRARMSGALKSKVKESPFDAKLQVKKVPWWSKVAFLKKLIVVPDQKHAIQVFPPQNKTTPLSTHTLTYIHPRTYIHYTYLHKFHVHKDMGRASSPLSIIYKRVYVCVCVRVRSRALWGRSSLPASRHRSWPPPPWASVSYQVCDNLFFYFNHSCASRRWA